MARWTDIAPRQEHTVNQGGSMFEVRGQVEHIAEGTYEGTIAWQKNPSAQVSSHFIVSRTGQICQMVDTDVVAWTQANGNGHWISVENEGYSGESLTQAQLEANALIFARVCSVYHVPLQVTSSTSGQGLGHHAMGGSAWGNHPNCPGTPIINQKQTIVNLAKSGGDMALTQQETDWLKTTSDRVGAMYDMTAKSVTGEPSAFVSTINGINTAVHADQGVTLSDEQLDALADKVATRLKALTFVADTPTT